MGKWALLVGLCAASYSISASAAEIARISVAKHGDVFIAEAEFVIDVPRDAAVELLTSFDRLYELNPAVIASQAQALPGGSYRVTTRVRDCVAFFCRSVGMVEDISIDGQSSVHAEIIPELSDFESGTTTWQFVDHGPETRIVYRSQVKPKFWLPPLLGSHAIQNALQRQIRATAINLESMSRNP